MREETIPAEAFGTERSRRRSEVPDASAIFQSSDPGEGEGSAPEAANPPDPRQTPEVTLENAAQEEIPGAEDETDLSDLPVRMPRLLGGRGRKGRRLVKKIDPRAEQFTPQQRLMILMIWLKSGLPAGDFAPLVGVSKHTLYGWKKSFDEHGPAGLMSRSRGGPRGSKLSEVTKQTIVRLKQKNPEYGCTRISDELARGPGLGASAKAVARVLHEAGYEMEEVKTRPHADKVRRFERARPNQLWQTDIFTFTLKRQNRRVHLVAFMDDNSRYIVGYGLYASMTGALVMEVVEAAIASFGIPEEILTDQGSQYHAWRGKSSFKKKLEKRGIKQLVSATKHPQTLGKIERFWGTMWRDFLEVAIFLDLEDARKRIGLFIDHYNFLRPHQGIDGLTPADRYFGAAEEVKKALAERVAANALDLARNGLPRKPFYMAGNVGGKGFSVHSEGDRVYMIGEDGEREEIDLADAGAVPLVASADPQAELPEAVCPTGSPQRTEAEVQEEPAPGTSPLDDGLRRIAESNNDTEQEGGHA